MWHFLKKIQKSEFGRLSYIGFAFFMALLYDFLFWQKEPGIGFFVFCLVYAVLFTLITLFFGHFRSRLALFSLLPFLIFSFFGGVYNNDFIRNFVPFFTVLSGLIFSFGITLQNKNKFPFFLRRIKIFSDLFIWFKKYKLLISDCIISKEQRKKDILKKIAIGFVISFPLLLIFGAFLSGADAVFAEKAKNFFQFENTLWWRGFRTFVFTFFVAGFFYVLIGEEHILSFQEKTFKHSDHVILGTVLSLVNVLFASFVLIQMKYLFSGKEFVLEKGLTYAEYARSGFFELMWVIFFSGILFFIAYRFTSKEKFSFFMVFLKILLLIQVGVIAFSALKRMDLYQAEYGYTVLRLFVEWAIYGMLSVLSVGAVSVLARVPFYRFFHVCLVLTFFGLVIASTRNVDFIIAKENVSRFLENKKLDVPYLTSLSADAFPAIVPLLQEEQFQKLSFDDRLSIGEFIKKIEKEVSLRNEWMEYNYGVFNANSLTTDDQKKLFEFLSQK